MLGRYTTGPRPVLRYGAPLRVPDVLRRAGVPGLEPRLTEPESVGLPITPYPMGCTRVPELPTHRRCTTRGYPIARAARARRWSAGEPRQQRPTRRPTPPPEQLHRLEQRRRDRRPVTATRTGPNATLRLQPQAVDQRAPAAPPRSVRRPSRPRARPRAPRSAASSTGAGRRRRASAPPRLVDRERRRRRRPGSRSIPRPPRRSVSIRSCTSGAAATQQRLLRRRCGAAGQRRRRTRRNGDAAARRSRRRRARRRCTALMRLALLQVEPRRVRVDPLDVERRDHLVEREHARGRRPSTSRAARGS